MSETVVIPTREIQPNPYQARLQEDPEAVAELAASIQRDGLMQVPTGRRVDGHVQLAFGHSRLAAFRLLDSQGSIGFDEMPVIVRELTDLQMFELGLAENIKRRNLNPIEQARAMRRYLDDFDKTSEEAAEFFSVSAETVRGDVRLLDLPAPVQEKVASRELTIGAARALLSYQRLVPNPDAMVKALDDVLHPGDMGCDSPEEAVASILGDEDGIIWLYEHDAPFLKTAPKNFPHKYLAPLKAATAMDILWPGEKQPKAGGNHKLLEDLKTAIERIQLNTKPDPNGAFEDLALSVAEIELLTILIWPPACTGCARHTSIDRDEFCGLKACFERKKHAWNENKAQQTSKKTGIAFYDARTDGQSKVLLHGYNERDRKIMEEKNEDLRLVPKQASDYSALDGVGDAASVVVVGKTAEKILAAEKKREASRGPEYGSPEYKEQQAREEALRKGSDQLEEFAIPLLAAAFEEMTNAEAMRALVRDERGLKDLSGQKLLKKLRELLAETALENHSNWSVRSKGPVAMAKYLAGVAKTWGVKLPKDWDERAKALMPPEEKPAEAKKAKKKASA